MSRVRDFLDLLNQERENQPERWHFVIYDQLNLDAFSWSEGIPKDNGLIFIETLAKGTSKKYHKQKLGFLISNMRHFALEAKDAGHPVRYIIDERPYEIILKELITSLGPIHITQPAERTMRLSLDELISKNALIPHEHKGWLTQRSWFVESVGENPPFRMDKFYRRVRHETGWLMTEGSPIGGKYSFDAENRYPWKGEPVPPSDPLYSKDEIDEQVEEMVKRVFPEHPGAIDLNVVPTSLEQHQRALEHAKQLLPHFGTYEDAMTTQSRGLFHSKLASSINLHRLMPLEVAQMVLSSSAPINSIEGFLRQLIWREYVRHVYEVTNGFLDLEVEGADQGRPNHLGQFNPLPDVFWGAKSGLHCLDHVVESVMEEGWTHHIPRLMILGNLATLLDVEPKQLSDWFHECFIDAFDWVVEPNVLGMASASMGTTMMTKPYVSGTPYINKMSDYCQSCALDPKKNCPISNLYWAFLERHKIAFEGNHRMSMAMRNLNRRSDEKKKQDEAVFHSLWDTLYRKETYLQNTL